jgi:zinc/manganese transport system ATP-binding protein
VIGWLAQRHALESQFPLNVQDVVSQGAWPGVSLLRGLGGDTRRRIGAVLERVGLAAWRKRRSKRSPAASFSACCLPG